MVFRVRVRGRDVRLILLAQVDVFFFNALRIHKVGIALVDERSRALMHIGWKPFGVYATPYRECVCNREN